jgi:dephospho-CoA kinase
VVIGITGGIATGKSAVTKLFARLGAVTFSADEASRAVLYQGGPAFLSVCGHFGSQILNADGSLNRGRLAEIVFRNPQERAVLNGIVHPRIRRLLKDQLESAAYDLPGRIVAVEVPLLYEGGLENWFERILVVTASEATELSRLMQRDSISEEEALRRIKAQYPLAEKARRATYVVDNDGAFSNLAPQVEKLWSTLQPPNFHEGLSTK